MWKFLLILAVVQASVKEIQSSKEFGCSAAVKGENLKPVYGQEVDPMKFENVNVLKDMVEKIHSIYTLQMENYIFNNFPEFHDMEKEYTKYNRTLSNSCLFYNAYLPEYTPSFVMKLLEEIVKKIENVKEHCYLVPSQRNYHETRGGLTEIPLKILAFRMFQEGIHISEAAVIRIEVDGRKGVILMDDGHSFFGPILLMEDGKELHLCSKSLTGPKFSPLNANTTTDEMYSVNIPKKNVVVVQKFDVKNKSSSYDQYFTKLPSCKFTQFILRGELIAGSIKRIYRRDSKGNLKASISFDMLSTDPEFTMTKFKDGHTEFEMNIKFGKRDELNENEMVNYQAVISEFKSVDIDKTLSYAERIVNFDKFIEIFRENRIRLMNNDLNCRNIPNTVVYRVSNLPDLSQH